MFWSASLGGQAIYSVEEKDAHHLFLTDGTAAGTAPFKTFVHSSLWGEVTVNGQPQKWSKGRFKLTLEDQVQQELNVVVGSDAFQ